MSPDDVRNRAASNAYVKKRRATDPEFRAYRIAITRPAQMRLYQQRRLWISGYKLMMGCLDCGYREHPFALQFDHRENKEFGIGARANLSPAKLWAEMQKCDIRCANCHASKTAERRIPA
jgi:hypothetical protein